jgi:hypothetical protein
MQSSGSGTTRNCVSCGRAIAWDANVCPYCGHDYRMQATAPPRKEKSGLPVAGGVLVIIASIGYFAVGGLIVGGSSIIGFGAGALCGVVLLILGIIALLGGIFAIQRKNFALALIGSIFVIPSILGLIGMILIAVGKDSFD